MDMIGLGRTAANSTALTPLTFLTRAAAVYPDRTAIVYGDHRITFREFDARTRRLASALAGRGIREGDTVSVMLPNVPAMLDVHYGIPMLGAVLNTINTRLDARTIAYILGHAESKVLITDLAFSPAVAAALAQLERKPLVIDVADPLYAGPGERLGEIDYAEFVAGGAADFTPAPIRDEFQPDARGGGFGEPAWVVVTRGICIASFKGELVASSRHPETQGLCTAKNLWLDVVDARTGERLQGLRGYDESEEWTPHVAGVDEIFEVDTFDDAPGAYIETRNDSFCQHSWSPIAVPRP
jgi:fatty-acyl-CoA synthase